MEEAIIMLFGSILTSILDNAWKQEAASDTYNRNRQLTAEDRAYYSPANQMAMMKEAGLNPHITQLSQPSFASQPYEAAVPSLDPRMFQNAMNILFKSQDSARKDDANTRGWNKDRRDEDYLEIDRQRAQIANQMSILDQQYRMGQIADQQYDYDMKQYLDESPFTLSDGRVVKYKDAPIYEKEMSFNRALMEISGLDLQQQIAYQDWLDRHQLHLYTIQDFIHAWKLADEEFNLRKILGTQQYNKVNQEILNLKTSNSLLKYQLGYKQQYESQDRAMEWIRLGTQTLGTAASAYGTFMSGGKTPTITHEHYHGDSYNTINNNK